MIKFKNISDSVPSSVNVEIRLLFINENRNFDTKPLFMGMWGDLSSTSFDFEKYNEYYVTMFPKLVTNSNVRLVINLIG